MELTKLWMWLLTYAGVGFYFANKGRTLFLNAQAANENFDVKDYIKNEAVDILLSLGTACYLLLGYKIEGINTDFTTLMACFSSGILIAYVGVNIVLRMISFIPGVNVGNGSQRKIREAVDTKTNKLDELTTKKK